MSKRNPTLPQDDRDDRGRERALASARNTWRYDFEALAPLASVDGVPRDDRVSASWAAKAAVVAAKVGVNSIAVRRVFADGGEEGLESIEDDEAAAQLRASKEAHEDLLERARDMLGTIEGDNEGLEGIGTAFSEATARALTDEVEARIADIFTGGVRPESDGEESLGEFISGPEGRPSSVDDHLDFFQELPTPAIASVWEDDAVFAYQRVAGPNAGFIQGVDALPDNLPLSDAAYRAAMEDGGDSLALAGAEGRLFVADYEVVGRVIEPTTFDGMQKYTGAPIALFAVPRGGGPLKAVCIQCEQEPGPDNPIYTPCDGEAWQLAKAVFQVAEMNQHEVVSHLARTHLFTEVSILATRRYLCPDRHPIWFLLVPHYEGTIFMNNSARNFLVAEGGTIDRTFAGTIQSSQALAVDGLKTYDFMAGVFPTATANRKTDAITDYPYRDDAALLWGAIHDWVTSYVEHYYVDDAAVVADSELQAWAAKLREPLESGGLPGFPEVPTRAMLATVCAHIIFVPSVQHAAVNFPQRTDMTWQPTFSGAGWRPVPSGEPIDAGDRLDFMPPLQITNELVQVLELLGGVYHTPLGTYLDNDWSLRSMGYPQWFGDPIVTGDLLPRFNARLKAIERTIAQRIETRPRPAGMHEYDHLLPSNVPMSINI